MLNCFVVFTLTITGKQVQRIVMITLSANLESYFYIKKKYKRRLNFRSNRFGSALKPAYLLKKIESDNLSLRREFEHLEDYLYRLIDLVN
jgi:hypothetical protein